MSELVLYRKYRPRHFDQIVGQDHIVGAIKSAIALNRVAHAYLFSGPRGVGKTTIARLVAKSLNCAGENKPCNACDFCREFNEGRAADLIEIDAASNRGIDEIRELREGVRVVPVRGKYKTYILDEVHMLTPPAFNALLKTLEEPPSHAVFVLATTELDKVPATIISRAQHYTFRRPTVAEICGRLAMLAKNEGIELAEEASRMIAFAAEGSLRDSESILGQVMAVSDATITRDNVESVLGYPRRDAGKKMFEMIAKKDVSAALSLIQELGDSGYDPSYFSKLLMQYYRNALFLKTDPRLKKYIEEEMLPWEHSCIEDNLPFFTERQLASGVETIFRNIASFRKSPIPFLPLELTVIELIHASQETV